MSTKLYYDNRLVSGSIVSASSEQADHPAESVLIESTHLPWVAGVKTSPAQVTLDIGAVGNYHIGLAKFYSAAGVSVTLESASDSNFTQNYSSEVVSTDPFIISKTSIRYLRVTFTKTSDFIDYPYIGFIFAFASELSLSRDYLMPLQRGFDSKSAAEISGSGVYTGKQYYKLRTYKLTFRGLDDSDISGIETILSVSGVVRPLLLSAPVIGGFICRFKEPPSTPLIYHAGSGYSEAELSLIEV